MKCANEWTDYELIDCSDGEKLERWGKYILLRPDPQIIWNTGKLYHKYKDSIDAIYHRSSKGGGYWENLKSVPSEWNICYKDLKFHIKQMGFKHTGLFPEQAVNWDWLVLLVLKLGLVLLMLILLEAWLSGVRKMFA